VNSLFIHNDISLAWQAVVTLTDRPSDILREHWGVENRGSGSPVERHLHGYGKTVTLRLEEGSNEITGYIKELARVRRFRISRDKSGLSMLTEQGGPAKTVDETLDDLVNWLKG
jgi:hypothetical protein